MLSRVAALFPGSYFILGNPAPFSDFKIGRITEFPQDGMVRVTRTAA
jgi:hypothetical protein